MKLYNYIIIFYFLFSNLFVSAQFEKTIPHRMNKEHSALIIETSTNDYVTISHYAGYEEYDHSSILFKISQDGEIMDSIYFSESNLGGDIININNNEILLSGYIHEERTQEEDGTILSYKVELPCFFKMDENFNMISIDTIPLPNNFPINPLFSFPQGFPCRRIIPTQNNNFLALCSGIEVCLYELSYDFDTIQTNFFHNNFFFLPIVIKNNNDSSFYFFSDLDVYHVNKNLEFTHIKNLNTVVYDGIIRKLKTVKYLNDNRILMYFGADASYQGANFEEQIGVYIVDTLLNVQDYVYFGDSENILDMPVMDRSGIDFTDENNIFVVSIVNHCGFHYMPENSEEMTSIMVSVLDSNLNIKNQTFYGGDNRYSPCDIKATSDGGCIIISSKYEVNSGNNYGHVHLLKVNENGELSPPISNEEINNSTMKLAFIYPNPSKDFINVRYGAHLKNVSIEIFDISGKKIFVKNLKNPISRIDIQNLKIGSYVYHILNDNKIIEKEILIKK